jgi:ADP-heptose:LPS heptosyltransferase
MDGFESEMRDYPGYRLGLAAKRLATAILRAILVLTLTARRSLAARRSLMAGQAPPRSAPDAGTVVLLDRCLGIGDALMISPALRLLAPLGPVTVVTALPPLLEGGADSWLTSASWADMIATVNRLTATGQRLLVPRLGLAGLLTLIRWPGGVPGGIIRLDPSTWLETATGERGPITGPHYTDGALACAQALVNRTSGHASVAPPTESQLPRLPPRLPADGGAALMATLALSDHRPLVGLAPWATSRIRRWPLDHWSQLINQLAEQMETKTGVAPIFMLLGSHDERPIGDQIIRGLSRSLSAPDSRSEASSVIPSGLDGDSSRLPSDAGRAHPRPPKVTRGLRVHEDAGPPSRPDTGDVSISGLAGMIPASPDESPSKLGILNLMGRLSLTETTAAVAHATVLIACDNGIMHLGLGVGTPVVAIFGSTDPAARLTGHRWRLAADPNLCPHRRAPCYPDLHRDPSCPSAAECLSGVSPDSVVGLALKDLLPPKEPRP